MRQFFDVGDIIYDYCNGYFGRDDYDTKICVMVNSKYAVFQYMDGEWEGKATVLNYKDSLCVDEIAKWKIKPEDENDCSCHDGCDYCR